MLKYGLKFEPVLPGSTDVYVLMSPIDGSYFAMLSRFKERRIDILDLKCGDFASMIRDLPGFEDPVRVKDDGWVGAILDRQNETAIKKAFDYAFKLAMNGETNNIAQDQYLYIPLDDSEHEYQSQPIRLRNNNFNKKPLATDRIHRMQELYDYSVCQVWVDIRISIIKENSWQIMKMIIPIMQLLEDSIRLIMI